MRCSETTRGRLQHRLTVLQVLEVGIFRALAWEVPTGRDSQTWEHTPMSPAYTAFVTSTFVFGPQIGSETPPAGIQSPHEPRDGDKAMSEFRKSNEVVGSNCPHCNGQLAGRLPKISEQRLWGVVTVRLDQRFMPAHESDRPPIMARRLQFKTAVALAADLNGRSHKKQISYEVVRTGNKARSHGVVKLDRRSGHACRIDLKYLTFDEARNHAKRFNLERTKGGATTLWSFVLAPEFIEEGTVHAEDAGNTANAAPSNSSKSEWGIVTVALHAKYRPQENTQPPMKAHGLTLAAATNLACLLYTSPSPRDRTRTRMPSSA